MVSNRQKVGDEIAVFTPAGLCVGATVCSDYPVIYLAAWKDNSLTEEIDGYQIGENMSFKFWDASAGVEIVLDFTYPMVNAVGSGFAFGQGAYASISLSGGNSMPTRYALRQNYPNPFNPTTVIRYDLPYQSEVELTVYNLLGQMVATLVNTTQTAGYHQVNWNVNKGSNSWLTSGIYFYRLSAKNTATGKTFIENRKMVLVK